MCGIAGITGRRADLVIEMGKRLAHRGPDDAGIFVDDSISLAHARLAVLDLSKRGAQPMSHAGLVIVYNGEVYNYREIRRELEGKGDEFYSGTDTEVVLHAFARWGVESLKKFNGMFAFAVYDQNNKRITLARDRLGIKPLYYIKDENALAFASEIKSLMPAMDSTETDREALVDYLTYRFVPDEKTLFKDVKRLKPAHYLTVDLENGDTECQPYWQLRFSDNGQSLDDNAEAVRSLLRESVRKRLVSDVPLGVYLSGGLDSSALVALMAEEASGAVDTYTVTFGDSALSEARHAKIVAEKFGTRHHEIDVEMNAVEVLPEVIRHLDEPIGDAVG
ncbi:asparagine synthase (glutamine-hydrolyzing), partial [Candidatus Hydrogenedentota bacterium]